MITVQNVTKKNVVTHSVSRNIFNFNLKGTLLGIGFVGLLVFSVDVRLKFCSVEQRWLSSTGSPTAEQPMQEVRTGKTSCTQAELELRFRKASE